MQGILEHTWTMKNKVIYYVMCAKQPKKLGVMAKDPCTISLKSVNMMVMTPASGWHRVSLNFIGPIIHEIKTLIGSYSAEMQASSRENKKE